MRDAIRIYWPMIFCFIGGAMVLYVGMQTTPNLFWSTVFGLFSVILGLEIISRNEMEDQNQRFNVRAQACYDSGKADKERRTKGGNIS